jgi:glycosyltransferase involved in cell wall biosynthesis
MSKSICFVGLQNLPVLAREYNQHGIGGEEVQQTLLARALSKRGHDVSMVVADFGQTDGEEWDGVKTFAAYKPSDGWPGLRFFVPRLSGMWSALKRANADVYYVSCASSRVGVCAAFSRIHARKLIFRIASDMDCEPDRLLIQQNYWRDKKMYEYGLRRADAILAQSVAQQEALTRNYHLSSRLAPMMVDQARFNLAFEERSVHALWVSNIRQLKRPDLFFEIAAGLPDLAMHMIGGEIPDYSSLYKDVEARARGMPNVTFHGQVPYHDVNDYFERTRVFVNTSDIEGFPNSYLQAWVRGTPVVAFFDPDGLIAREGLGRAVSSVEEMRSAVAELSSDAAVWRAASERCKSFMASAFDEDRILEPYLKVING